MMPPKNDPPAAVVVMPLVVPVGDLHSVPHYRCGRCFGAVVMYQNDKKPDVCPWCGCGIDWNKKDPV